MKIIGVSVDVENLPSKKVLISMAMKTRLFCENPLAEQEIEAELKKSGLYPKVVEPKKEEENGLHRNVAKKPKSAKPKK